MCHVAMEMDTSAGEQNNNHLKKTTEPESLNEQRDEVETREDRDTGDGAHGDHAATLQCILGQNDVDHSVTRCCF